MASETFIVVTDDETKPDHQVEIPVEQNNLLLVSTLDAQFPGATGLKYRTDTGAFRGLRVADGYVHPPSDNGWGEQTLFVVVIKAQAKRKADEAEGAPPAKSVYQHPPEPNPSTSDLIVLGLPWKATTADLQQYFSQYGQLAVCQVNLNSEGQSKGFGFIRFVDADVNQKVLSTGYHYVLGRRCEVKLPLKKGQPPLPKKLFVGCLTNSITRDDMLNYFTAYGPVTDIYIPNPFRGFGFVTFAESTSTARALEVTSHVIQGVQVNVTIPQPRKEVAAPAPAHHVGIRGQEHQGMSSQALLGQLALAAAAGNPNFAGFGMDMSAFGLQGGHSSSGGQAHSVQSASRSAGATGHQYHW